MPDFLTVPETAEKCRVHWRVRRDALDKMLAGVPLDELPPLKPIAA